MADVIAQPGIKTAFLGGDDVLICTFPRSTKNGVQIEAEGFTLDNSTITAYGHSSDEPDTVVVGSAKKIAVIDGGTGPILIREIRMSGVSAGSYSVTFIEL